MSNVFEKCVWVGADEKSVSPVILRRFALSEVKKATLFVTGLGYFEARINGKPVTDQLFLPVVSDYEPRDLSKFIYPLKDKPTNRIYYYDFEIAELLQEGENLLEIQLGTGWYRQKERVAEGDTSYGEILKAIYKMKIETADDTLEIGSDGSETWTESNIRESNLFYGEVIDYNYVPGEEQKVTVLPAAQAELSSSIGTPDRIIGRITPKLLGEKDGRKVFDAGVNISGLVELKTTAPKGSAVTLRFAEAVNDDLSLICSTTGSGYISPSGKAQIMEDTFITDGGLRVFRPKFTWHAFRYFEVEGPFDEVEVCVIHSDTPITAEFTSNFEGMDYLFHTFLRTQLNNMHGSIPSDCPHRERLGYTGDGQNCAAAAMMMLDSREFYKKWIQDILDCQDPYTGHVQHTAPLMGGGGGPGGWGSAMVIVPYAYYKQFGDTDMIRKCYEPMCRWMDYLKAHSEDGLIVREEEGGWCLGDWCTLEPTVIPEPYVNSCFMVKTLSMLEEMAGAIGKDADIAGLRQLRESVMDAIRRTYYDEATGSYAQGVQGADAYAVWCGLAGAETAERVADFYRKLGHFDTGFLGTDVLLEVLFAYGHGDVAITLFESEELGSFLYMKRHGATTLWETWNMDLTVQYAGSMDHPMFGGCSRHLFSGVLGMRQKEGTVGYQEVVFAPALLPEGKKVSGSIVTPQGELSVELDCTAAQPTAAVKAPAGIRVTCAENLPYAVTCSTEQ